MALYSTGSKYPHLNHSLIWTDMMIFLLIAELHFARAIREILVITWPFRNHTCRNASLVNANMSPIICSWKLVKHRYCFGDNRRTKDIRKIKAERSSYAVLKRVAWLSSVAAFLITFRIKTLEWKVWSLAYKILIAKIKRVPKKVSEMSNFLECESL